jgi:hypothetical protein
VETAGVNKGLEEQERMTEPLFPITNDSLLTQRKHTGTQIRDVPVGKDEKPAVVYYPLQPIILVAIVPPNPAVPGGTLPCGCGKRKKGEPFIAP